MNSILRIAGHFLLATALAFFVPGAWAQDAYPNKPIRIMVPWPTGGAVDIAPRIVSDKLSVGLGRPVVINNRVREEAFR